MVQTHGARRRPAREGILISGILWQSNKGTKIRSNSTGPNAKHTRETLHLKTKLPADLTAAAGQPRPSCVCLFLFLISGSGRCQARQVGGEAAPVQGKNIFIHSTVFMEPCEVPSSVHGPGGNKPGPIPAAGSLEEKAAHKQLQAVQGQRAAGAPRRSLVRGTLLG